MHYHSYIVVPAGNIFTENLPEMLRFNISTAAIFQAPNSVRSYLSSEEEVQNSWIVCYGESEFGSVDLQLELGRSGYRVAEQLDAISIPLLDDVKIPKLIGYLPFSEVVLGEEIIQEFKTEFNPEIFDLLLRKGAYIDPILFEVESNIDYIGKYLISYITVCQDVPVQVMNNIQMKLNIGDVYDLVANSCI